MSRYIHGDRYPLAAWTLDLRTWHIQCLVTMIERMNANERTIAIAAVMGAGKTILALRWLHYLLDRNTVRLGVIVVPTDNLRLQFCRDAKAVGIRAYAITATPDRHPDHSRRVSCVPALDGPLPADAHAIVLTYAQLSIETNVRALAALCEEAKTVWVFDEIHHAGDGYTETDPALKWGDGMARAAARAAYRLLTTATPNRTDGRPIPFIRYVDRVPQFDFIYSYGEALGDGYVRLVEFIRMDSLAEWWTAKDGDLRARLTDPIPRDQYSKRLNAVIDSRHAWIGESLRAGVTLIRDMRTAGRHTAAAGLVVAKNRSEAEAIAKLLANQGARGVVVVTFDDPEASAKIDAFRDSADEWIVAVRMVSEGIDIKRLRVIVYATNATTELLFLQILGRVLRFMPEVATPQIAHMIVPPDPRILAIIDTYRTIIMRALKVAGVNGKPPKTGQENLWYAVGASGFEHGRVYDSTLIDQRWIDEAAQYAQGNADVQTLIAMALRDKLEHKGGPGAPAAGASSAWDAEKHKTYDAIKAARTKLINLRIRSGRYASPAEAAQSVNYDMYSVFGAFAGIRNDPAKTAAYLDLIQTLIASEAAHGQ